MSTISQLLKELREKANAASEGPWCIESGMNYTETESGTRFQHIMGAHGKGICNTSHYDEVRINGELASVQRHGKMQDAELIAASRAAVPLLLDLLEEAMRSLENITFMADEKQPIGDAVDHAQESLAKMESKANNREMK